MRMNIPVGISDFEQIRSKGYYYIDKSGMIAEILNFSFKHLYNWARKYK